MPGITTRLGNSCLHDALRALAEMLANHANAGKFEIGDEDLATQARNELRSWIKLSLIVGPRHARDWR